MDYEVEEMYNRLPELENEAKEKRREEEENERLVREYNRRKQRFESIFIKYGIIYYANDKIDAAEYTDLMDFVVERCLEKSMTEQKPIYEFVKACVDSIRIARQSHPANRWQWKIKMREFFD